MKASTERISHAYLRALLTVETRPDSVCVPHFKTDHYYVCLIAGIEYKKRARRTHVYAKRNSYPEDIWPDSEEEVPHPRRRAKGKPNAKDVPHGPVLLRRDSEESGSAGKPDEEEEEASSEAEDSDDAEKDPKPSEIASASGSGKGGPDSSGRNSHSSSTSGTSSSSSNSGRSSNQSKGRGRGGRGRGRKAAAGRGRGGAAKRPHQRGADDPPQSRYFGKDMKAGQPWGVFRITPYRDLETLEAFAIQMACTNPSHARCTKQRNTKREGVDITRRRLKHWAVGGIGLDSTEAHRKYWDEVSVKLPVAELPTDEQLDELVPEDWSWLAVLEGPEVEDSDAGA